MGALLRLITAAAVVVGGSLALPLAASAAPRPAFSLTLYPARVIVPVGEERVTFNLLNGGAVADHVTVTAAAAWLIPDEPGFDLAAGDTHATSARIALPTLHDVGDLSTTLAFTVAATNGSGTGSVRVSRAVAALLIVETPGASRHALSWSGLQLPRFVDPMGGPVLVAVTATNSGTVHETLDPVLGDVGGQVLHFEPAILLRGTSRTLRANWSPPLLCWCTVKVRGQAASVVVFPLRATVALLLIVGGFIALAVLRRRQRAQP